MIYALLTSLIPSLIGAYYSYQLAYNRSTSGILWALPNFLVPFAPLAVLTLWKPKLNKDPRAQALWQDASIRIPMSLRAAPSESRASKPGWALINKWGISWVEATRDETSPLILEWDLEAGNSEKKAFYRDGLINLWLMPPSGAYSKPVALVGGTSFMVSRFAASATLVSLASGLD